MAVARLHFTVTVLISLISLQGVYGSLLCEKLPAEVCSFSVSLSGARCVLEMSILRDGTVQYECQTSDVIAENRNEFIETEECINACGLDATTVGMSTDTLDEPAFTTKLCSPRCYNKCPNIIDLYSSLAAGQGISLSNMCEAHRSRDRRMISEVLFAPAQYGYGYIPSSPTTSPVPIGFETGTPSSPTTAPVPIGFEVGTPTSVPIGYEGVPISAATAPAPIGFQTGTPNSAITAPGPIGFEAGTPSSVPIGYEGVPISAATAPVPIGFETGTPSSATTAPGPIGFEAGTPSSVPIGYEGVPSSAATAPVPIGYEGVPRSAAMVPIGSESIPSSFPTALGPIGYGYIPSSSTAPAPVLVGSGEIPSSSTTAPSPVYY